jgi:hypothetical protein
LSHEYLFIAILERVLLSMRCERLLSVKKSLFSVIRKHRFQPLEMKASRHPTCPQHAISPNVAVLMSTNTQDYHRQSLDTALYGQSLLRFCYLHESVFFVGILLLRSAFFWNFRQGRMVIFYRCFGKTSRSYLLTSSGVLEMGTIGCPVTSVRNYPL